jgi:hypothetical protein
MLKAEEATTMQIDRTSVDRSLWAGLLGDGRPALATIGVALAFAGGLAVYLGFTRQLLPHDLAYLGMSAVELGDVADGRLMDFMVHDRVSWGGSLFAVGVMYLWLTVFPLADGKRWAWMTIAVTGAVGFASFASHLPTGYLDSWHGVGTLLLIPVFAVGLARSRSTIIEQSFSAAARLSDMTWGRRLVLATGVGLAVSAMVIMAIGMTVTFVSSDLDFIGLETEQLTSLNERLVSLVAHDRIGFAGGVLVSGLLIASIAVFGEGRAARQAVAVGGLFGFGLAVGIHFAVGYTDLFHIAPALIGPAALLTGLIGWSGGSRET